MSAELNVSLRLLLDQVQGDASKAAAIIKQQIGAVLGSGGQTPIQQGAKGASEIARAMAQGAQATAKMRSDLDKISSGGGNLGKFKTFPAALQKAILSQHPELASEITAPIVAATKKAKDDSQAYYGWLKKAANESERLAQSLIRGNWSYKQITQQGLSGYGMGNRPNFGFASPSTPSFFNQPDFFTKKHILSWSKLGLGAAVGVGGNPFIGSRILSDEFGKFSKSGGGGIAGGLFGKAGAIGFAEIYLGFKSLEFVIGLLKKSAEALNKTMRDANGRSANALTEGVGLGFFIKRNFMSQILGVSEQDVLKFSGSLNQFGSSIDTATKALVDSTRNLTSVQQQKNMFAVIKSAFDAEVARTYSGIYYLNAKNDAWVSGVDLKMRKWFNDHVMEPLHLLAPEAPTPLARMNQLPSSALEKMGLVIGGSGHSTNDLLKQIVKQTTITAAALSGPHWRYIRTPFGMQSVPNQP